MFEGGDVSMLDPFALYSKLYPEHGCYVDDLGEEWYLELI